jgi:hypothetical protein
MDWSGISMDCINFTKPSNCILEYQIIKRPNTSKELLGFFAQILRGDKGEKLILARSITLIPPVFPCGI